MRQSPYDCDYCPYKRHPTGVSILEKTKRQKKKKKKERERDSTELPSAMCGHRRDVRLNQKVLNGQQIHWCHDFGIPEP